MKLIVIDDEKKVFENVSCCSWDAVSFHTFCKEVAENEFDFDFSGCDAEQEQLVVVSDDSEKLVNSCCTTGV